MKVLLPIIYHDLTHCIALAFERAGHIVRVVDWRQFQKEQHRHKLEPFCISEARKFQPDLAFCQFQAPGLISDKFPKALNDLGCFSINWTGDVRHPLPQWYIDLAEHFTVTSFTNHPDVEAIRSLGHRSEFLQIGYDDRLYNTDGAGDRDGVVFIGNNYGGYKYAESESRRAMVKALKGAFGFDFAVYGMSWEEYGGKYVREPGDADILRRSLVATGWDHFHRPGFASDRLLRATACGCATVNQYYKGIEEEHPHVIAVETIGEMVDAVRTLLNDPDKARYIGEKSAAWTREHHLWDHRVKQIEQWMA